MLVELRYAEPDRIRIGNVYASDKGIVIATEDFNVVHGVFACRKVDDGEKDLYKPEQLMDLIALEVIDPALGNNKANVFFIDRNSAEHFIEGQCVDATINSNGYAVLPA